jgi:MFS family permease
MPQADVLLEASRVLIGLGLAVFIGVPLALLVGSKRKIFLEGEERKEEREGERFGRAKFVAAGAMLVGVLLEVQVMGSALPARHVWRAAAIFLLLAALVSAVMVVLPRERYYREKSLTIEETLRQPWVRRADAARRRAGRVDFFGFLLALAALVLG